MSTPPQDKPTGWTPTDDPVSVDKLGRQKPPERWITIERMATLLPESRFVRAWVQVLTTEAGNVVYELFFEVDTKGAPYVYRCPARFNSLDMALAELARWVGGVKFGVE